MSKIGDPIASMNLAMLLKQSITDLITVSVVTRARQNHQLLVRG